MEDYTHLLDLLDTQLWYFGNVIKRRNQFSDQAMITHISDYWQGDETRTPLELAYHAVSPLNQLCEIIRNPTLQWGDVKIDRLSLESPAEEFVELYRRTLDKAKTNLQAVDLTKFTGNMSEYRTDPKTLLQRVKIFCMHIMTHYGQALKFQGMICHSLEERG